MPHHEADVLKPVDPALTDSDAWPIFVLTDARIVFESNGRLANLLAAYADTPLRVQGRLQVPGRAQSKYFLQKPHRPIDMEIRNVTRFSYGQLMDGAYVIWAQGGAGWFEIQPTADYRPIFDDMVKAVELLYFVTDIYNEPRKRGGGPSAQLIFQEYAEDERYPDADPVIVESVFNQHHVVLMTLFMGRAQGLSWSNTPLYQYFRRKHPKDFETCKARAEGRYTHIQPGRPARTSRNSPAATTASKPTMLPAKPRAVRGSLAAPIVDEAPKKDDNWWEAAALFEFMQKAVNQRALKVGRNHITLERVAHLVVRRYEIDTVEAARNVLLVHARNLCYMMDHPRRKAAGFFVEEPIYRELAAVDSLSAVEQRRAEGVALKPRRDRATLKEGGSVSSDTSDENDDVMTPVRPQRGRRNKGRLSVLRPKNNKFSGKSKGIGNGGGQGKGKAPYSRSGAPHDKYDTESSDNGTSTEDDTSADMLTQAQSLGRAKRKLDVSEVAAGEGDQMRKRTASMSIVPDSPPTSAGSDDDSENNELQERLSANGPPVPLQSRPSHVPSGSRPQTETQPAMAAHIISTPLPTYEANGPRDSWICNFDGCSQRIYGCSKDIGKQLITEHLEDHTKGRAKVVGILWREQDKLHLPVNNLIKRIRELSEASTPLFPMSGASTANLPQHIQRPV